MKTALFANLIAAASFARAEVVWTFKKFESGIEVPAFANKSTAEIHTVPIAESGNKDKNLTARASDATVTDPDWCGAALTGGGFTSVAGIWAVPALSLRSDQATTPIPGTTQWVGIDGFINPGLIQGGILSTLMNGQQQNSVFMQMQPAGAMFPNLPVGTGDVVTVNVAVTSPTSGVIFVRNTSRNTAITGVVSGGTALSGNSAQWILGDFFTSAGPQPYAAFQDSAFIAQATRFGGNITPAGATMINLVQNGQQLCAAGVSGTAVTVQST